MHAGLVKRIFPKIQCPKKCDCRSCRLTKIHKFLFKESIDRYEYGPGVRWESDGAGPFVKSLGRKVYRFVYICTNSGFIKLFLVVYKSEQPICFIELIKFSRAMTGDFLRILKCDGAGEYVSKVMQEIMRTYHIHQELSAPYASPQNGRPERINRIVDEGVCAMMNQAGSPARFWGECMKAFVFVYNHVSVVKNEKDQLVSRFSLLISQNKTFYPQ